MPSKPRRSTRDFCMAKPSRSECAPRPLWPSAPGICQRRRLSERSERVIATLRPHSASRRYHGFAPGRVASPADKKTVQGKVHFVLPTGIGDGTASSRASTIDLVVEAIESGSGMTGTTPRGVSRGTGCGALGARHVRPNRRPLRPAEPRAFFQPRPPLARAGCRERDLKCWTRPGARVLDVCCGTGDVLAATGKSA